MNTIIKPEPLLDSLFLGHKMSLLVLLGLSKDRNDRFPNPFRYFNKWNMPEAWEKYPFWAQPPRIVPYRKSPPPLPSWVGQSIQFWTSLAICRYRKQSILFPDKTNNRDYNW